MDTINIAKDFTRYPGGRYPADGEGNGTDFREKFLLPVLQKKERSTVLLNGAVGYPSSFLDEAFAGLVRENGFSSSDILRAFDFVATDPGFDHYIDMIKNYVRDAEQQADRPSSAF